MAEGKVIDQGDAAKVVVVAVVQAAQPGGQAGPQHVRVGVDEDVPVVAGPLAPHVLGHVYVLVLVEAPAGGGGGL